MQTFDFLDGKTKSVIIAVLVWGTTTHLFVVWYNELIDYRFGNESFCRALTFVHETNLCIKMVAGLGYASLLLPIVFGLVTYGIAKRLIK